jgi:putative ABC transport system substrate-binding protein
MPRIGVLGTFSPASAESSHVWEAFLQGLRELGSVEGQNMLIVGRNSGTKIEQFPALAAELVRLEPDVIVAATGTPAARAAQRATSTIPIVMAIRSDPVGSGLVASLARPGGNVTGLSSSAPELVGKQLQLLKEAVPKISRVAVLSNPNNPVHTLWLKDAEAAARSLPVRLQILKVREPTELGGAFSTMAKEGAGALIVFGDGMYFGQRVRIVELAARGRMPTIFTEGEFAKAGGLMAYGPDLRDNFRRAAAYVDISKYVGLVKSFELAA